MVVAGRRATGIDLMLCENGINIVFSGRWRPSWWDIVVELQQACFQDDITSCSGGVKAFCGSGIWVASRRHAKKHAGRKTDGLGRRKVTCSRRRSKDGPTSSRSQSDTLSAALAFMTSNGMSPLSPGLTRPAACGIKKCSPRVDKCNEAKRMLRKRMNASNVCCMRGPAVLACARSGAPTPNALEPDIEPSTTCFLCAPRTSLAISLMSVTMRREDICCLPYSPESSSAETRAGCGEELCTKAKIYLRKSVRTEPTRLWPSHLICTWSRLRRLTRAAPLW